VRHRQQEAEAATATWVVYVLRCADGTLYTSVTNDLARRLRQHNTGTASRYTRCRVPVELA
jgi:putative endonuclease